MSADARASYVLDVKVVLDRQRTGIEDEVNELNRLVMPSLDLVQLRAQAGSYNNHVPTNFRNELHDTTALTVVTTLVNGMMSHLTPIGAQWCSFQAADESTQSAEALHWLHYAGQTLLKLYSPSVSNFYTALVRSCQMDACFGTSVVIPRVSHGRLVLDSMPILTYSLACDADDVPSTLVRTYSLTASQCQQLFGEDTPPDILKCLADPEKKHSTHKIVHLIEPNKERDWTQSDGKNLPFRITFVDEERKRVIREEGAWEQPHAVSTWQPMTSGPYGTSPFSDVIPDIRQLQNLALNRSILVERAGNPPWFIPPGYDGKFDPRPHALNVAGGRTAGADVMPREMPVTGRLDYLQAEAQDKQARVKAAGFYDLFKLLSTSMDQQKTAYEVRELMGEKATLFHPFFARKTQQLTQINRRCLALALRAGLIKPPPPELLQRLPNGQVGLNDPEIQYNSKLARALELNETNALLSTINALMPFAGQDGLNSPLFDFLEADKCGPEIARTYGVNHAMMSKPNKVAAKQKARADAAAQAATAQQAQMLTQGVRNLGGAEQAKIAMESMQ